MLYRKILFKSFLVFAFLVFTNIQINGAPGNPDEPFNPGTFILDHIGDAYEWHILSYNDFHLSVPMPVILYSKTSGFHLFFANKFKHGSASYKGFAIASGDHPNKGKIIEIASNKRPTLDLSITKNVFALFVSVAILLWVMLSVAKVYVSRGNRAPIGLQSWVEPLILFVRDDIARPAIGHHYKRFMPFLLTVFFFILINNLTGLIPIFPFGANVTGNIAVTAVLATFTFVVTMLGTNKGFWGHIFNMPGVPWWLKLPVPLMPFIELIGIFIKPFVLMIRLFANVTAGHIIIMGIFCLIFLLGNINIGAGYATAVFSVLFTIFMSFLELLVAFIQAYVFTILSALYFGMATQDHH
jgi:F-type H+-transporting ATPase subunit a